MEEQVFKGRTEDAEAPFLGGEFWKAGIVVVGVVERVFKIEGRNNYTVNLVKPVEVENEPYDRVNVGESAGLRMAFQAARVSRLIGGDKIVLECTGETASKKAGNSPRRNFSIEVRRPKSNELLEWMD